MRFDPPLVEGTLIRRYKRFLTDVLLDDGREIVAHCPNPGSMKTCAEPGWRVWLSPATNPARKLKWTWEVVLAGDAATPVLVNTQRPNNIVREAVEAGAVPELDGYSSIRPEVKYGENSRIDLFLTAPDRPDCFVEIKNATMESGPGCVAFPDSVTKRGAKHMVELGAQARAGHRAVVFFLVSRGDAQEMAPADDIDPAYGVALRAAVADGVEVLAYRADIQKDGVGLGPSIPVRL